MQHNKKRRCLLIAIISFITVLLIGSLLILVLNGYCLLPCLFNKLTGLYCPGCGMTRAIISFWHFDFISCFRNNMLFFVFLPLGLYYIICVIRTYIKFGVVISINQVFSKWVICGLLLLVIGFGVIRNLGWFYWIQPI